MKRRLAGFAVLVTLLTGVSSAEAAYINGTIAFVGRADPIPTATCLDWSCATGINFALLGNQTSLLTPPTGVYAAVTPGTNVTFNDFLFASFPPGVTPLWSFSFGGNNYSFDLLTLSNFVQAPGALSFTGTGTLYATGYDPTPGTFSFNSNTKGPSGDIFLFQADNTATPPPVVPEPGSLILLGTGLVGLGNAARRRWQQKA